MLNIIKSEITRLLKNGSYSWTVVIDCSIEISEISCFVYSFP